VLTLARENRIIEAILALIEIGRCRSTASHLLQVFRVAGPLHRDRRCGVLDLPEIVECKLDRDCPDVLVQALQLPSAGDWNNPWLLGKQPSQRYLGRRRLLSLSDVGKQITSCD
jgi:hypothetical protein